MYLFSVVEDLISVQLLYKKHCRSILGVHGSASFDCNIYDFCESFYLFGNTHS